MTDLQGTSFSPGLAQNFRNTLNGQPNQLPQNTSQALQVLSLHLPSFLGGAPIAPDALLRGGGSMTPDTAVRAQTSGTPAPAPTAIAPPPVSAPPPPASQPLSVATPTPAGSSAPVDTNAIMRAISAFAPTAPASPIMPSAPDTGPAPSTGPAPLPSFIVNQPSPSVDRSAFGNLINSFFGPNAGGNGGGLGSVGGRGV